MEVLEMDSWIIWFLREYGNYAIPATVVAVLAVFGYQAYKKRI